MVNNYTKKDLWLLKKALCTTCYAGDVGAESLKEIILLKSNYRGFKMRVVNNSYLLGEAKTVLFCSYEDLPLYINTKRTLSEVIVRWRLQIGK